MTARTRLALALIGAGVGAAALFATLATASHAGTAKPFDRAMRRRIRRGPRRRGTMQVVTALGRTGKWTLHLPLATLGALQLWRRGHARAGAAMVLASAAGAVASKVLDRTIFHVAPPPGRGEPAEYSFPSGHSLEPAAIALTAGYVLLRERLAPASIAIPLALAVPVASGAGRLYLDRHWASDVIGGWLAGAAIAALCGAAYEATPDEAFPRA